MCVHDNNLKVLEFPDNTDIGDFEFSELSSKWLNFATAKVN